MEAVLGNSAVQSISNRMRIPPQLASGRPQTPNLGYKFTWMGALVGLPSPGGLLQVAAIECDSHHSGQQIVGTPIDVDLTGEHKHNGIATTLNNVLH